MRMIKSPAEVDVMRQAGQIAGAMMGAAHGALAAGVPEYEAALARANADLAAAIAVWRDAAWQSPGGLRPLGTYVADVATAASGDIEALVDTLAGPVRASGTAGLSGGRYVIDARIGPADTMDGELRHALSLIAVAEENGYLLRLDGALAAPQ